MRSFAVKISDVFLSENGTDFTIPCSLTIDNFDDLKLQHVGSVAFTASGRAITTIVPAASVEFEIKIVKLKAPVYEQLVQLAYDNLTAQNGTNDLSDVSFPVQITGVNSDDSTAFDAVFSPSKLVTKQSFIDSHFYGISLKLIKI